MKADQRCENCQYLDAIPREVKSMNGEPVSGAIGRCHAHPPVLAIWSNPPGVDWLMPMVEGDNWCGEWAAREAGASQEGT